MFKRSRVPKGQIPIKQGFGVPTLVNFWYKII